MEGSSQKAMDQALRLLSFRARSEREMSERLAARGLKPKSIEQAVARLRELGLLNDGALARDMADSRRRSGRGDHRIRLELKKRGLPPDSIAEAMAEIPAQDGDDRAWAALRKRALRLKSVDRDTAYRRLHGFLARQGFGVDETRTALKRYFSKDPEEEITEP